MLLKLTFGGSWAGPLLGALGSLLSLRTAYQQFGRHTLRDQAFSRGGIAATALLLRCVVASRLRDRGTTLPPRHGVPQFACSGGISANGKGASTSSPLAWFGPGPRKPRGRAMGIVPPAQSLKMDDSTLDSDKALERGRLRDQQMGWHTRGSISIQFGYGPELRRAL